MTDDLRIPHFANSKKWIIFMFEIDKVNQSVIDLLIVLHNRTAHSFLFVSSSTNIRLLTGMSLNVMKCHKDKPKFNFGKTQAILVGS